MQYRIKVKKTLVTDNDKSFNVGSDIYFEMKGISYIGEIKKIGKGKITLIRIDATNNATKETFNLSKLKVELKDIEPNSCNYVYVD